MQVGGFAFLMGGVVMFAYQMWAWWRHTQQASDIIWYDAAVERRRPKAPVCIHRILHSRRPGKGISRRDYRATCQLQRTMQGTKKKEQLSSK